LEIEIHNCNNIDYGMVRLAQGRLNIEYLYRISESITKDYFDLPPDFQDAWCYPSVAKKGHFNVCFRKDKRAKLKLIGSQIASVVRKKDDYLFHAKLVTKIGADGESLTYHQIGSDEQRELFPEIMLAEM